MHGVQLSQDYRATMRRQFTFSSGLPATHLIDLGGVKGSVDLGVVP